MSGELIEKIKARVAAVDPANKERKVIGVFQLVLTGADTKYWIIDLKDLKVSEGKHASPDVTCTMSDADFVAIGNKEVKMEDAVSGGKVKVEGDKVLAGKLMESLHKK